MIIYNSRVCSCGSPYVSKNTGWYPTKLILKADFLIPSDQLFKELNWLKFPKSVEYHTSLMIYKALNGQAPPYVTSMISFVSEHHARQPQPASNGTLHIPRSNTTLLDNAFSVNGPKLWKSLYRAKLKIAVTFLNLNGY